MTKGKKRRELENRLKEQVLVLNLPFTHSQIRHFVRQNSEDETKLFLAACEEVKDYNDTVRLVSMMTNPGEYEKIEAEYEADLKKIDEEYVKQQSAIQKGLDEELDEIDAQTDHKLKAINDDFFEKALKSVI